MRPRHLSAFTATACLVLCISPAGARASGFCVSREVRTRSVHGVAPPRNFARFQSSPGVLRRPQTPADLQGFTIGGPADLLVEGPYGPAFATFSVVYADYIRRLGSVDGYPEYLVPVQVQIVAPMSRRCLRRLSAKARLRQVKLEAADRARGVVLALTGRASGPIPARSGVPGGGWTTATGYAGIVPDGVSSVTVILDNNAEATAQVTDNFFSIQVPSPQVVATVIWRDGSGHTLRLLPQ
jgi:hypothetical protein